MPGFFVEIGFSDKIKNFNVASRFKKNKICTEYFYAERFAVSKFLNDKIFFDDDDYFIILDGFILNKKIFFDNPKNNNDWKNVFIRLYQQNGEDFYKLFRGSFCGVLFDKKNKKWIVFSDHIGSKALYYTKTKTNLVISTDIQLIYFYFKQNNIEYTFNPKAGYLLLSYGFMLEDYTLCNQIKRLLPGYYIRSINRNVEIKEFYKLNNTPDEKLNENEIIEGVDQYFKKAIKLQFEKDKEYNYNPHFVFLSGGLDSRMTCWVAHEMGYTNQLNFTYSQSNYIDENVAKKIASDLTHEWLFKSLDGGAFLLDFESVVNITGGNALYTGHAHVKNALQYFNCEKTGLSHSGQLGDVILGSYSRDYRPFSFGDGAYSKDLIENCKNIELQLEYNNQELFMLYNRGFLGINSGLLIVQDMMETMSPFYDIDFLNFALSIPIKHRRNHNVYKKWIISKYPKATEYIWEKSRSKITDKCLIKYKNYKYPVKIFLLLIMNKILNNRIFGLNSKRHMNPFNYWFRTNFKLNDSFDKYFYHNIDLVKDTDLKKSMLILYQQNKPLEKMQNISLLSVIKKFF